MTNGEALKALYAALGGDPADVATDNLSAEVIAAMAALEFSDEDDRFFVFKATAPTGVTSGERNITLKDGVTYQKDIFPALEAGKIVICVLSDGGFRGRAAIPINYDIGGQTPTNSSGIGIGLVGTRMARLTIGAYSATIAPETEYALPFVTTSDNGKVLTVVNGNWKAVTPT